MLKIPCCTNALRQNTLRIVTSLKLRINQGAHLLGLAAKPQGAPVGEWGIVKKLQ